MLKIKNLLFLGAILSLFVSITILQVSKEVKAQTKEGVRADTKGETRNPNTVKHPPTVRTPKIKPGIEERETTLNGILKEIISDSFDESDTSAKDTVVYQIETADSRFVPIEFQGVAVSEKFRDADIEVKGEWNKNGGFVVQKILSFVPHNTQSVIRNEVETLNGDGNPMKLNVVGPEPTVGAYKVLVVPVNFTDVTSQPIAVSQIRDILYSGSSSVNYQFQEMSKGRFKLTGIQRPDIDILDWVTLPHTSDNCQSNMLGTWTAEARAIAQAQGFAPSEYRTVILVFPGDIPSCMGWGGQGTLGVLGNTTSSSNVWIQYQAGLNFKFLRQMFIHEMGHNLGLMHASLVKNCDPQAVIPGGCQTVEYGDHFSHMGDTSTFLRNYNNIDLEKLGWFSMGAKVTNLPQAGTYNLNLLSPSFPARVGYQSISFALKDENGVPTGQSAYLEFRRQVPPFDMFNGDTFQNVTKGVSIRFAPSDLSTRTNSYLLDTTTQTPNIIDDAAIEVGQTYQNSTYGFSIRTNSTNPTRGANLTLQLTR